MSESPKKYEPPGVYYKTPSENHYTGTDLYLSLITVFLTSMVVRTGVGVVMSVHQYQLNEHILWGMMAVTSVIAAKDCLNSTNGMYKQRVCNSICSGLKTVFIGPFTAVAQMAHSLTSGFSITKNLFD